MRTMIRCRFILGPACALSVFAAPAAAQPALNAAMVDIVREWTAATDLPEPVKEFGEDCLLPRLIDLPEDAKQIVADAGNLDDGVDAADLYDVVQECTEAMLVGEQIWKWVAGDGTAEKAICMMEAVRPLPTEAKLTLFEAFDIGEGLAALRINEPGLAAALDEDIAACA